MIVYTCALVRIDHRVGRRQSTMETIGGTAGIIFFQTILLRLVYC